MSIPTSLCTSDVAMLMCPSPVLWRGAPQLASVVQANVKMFEELKLYRSAENSQQRIDQLVSGRF